MLDGLVVSNGSAVFANGAGILATDSQLEVRNCTFRRNSGYQGIGTCVAILDGFASFYNCEFIDNWGRFVDGVGICSAGTAGVTVERCRFYDNHADADSSRGNGAGIALEGATSSTVKECTFEANFAIPFFSNYFSYGGAIHNSGPSLIVDRCTFRNNRALMGGGIFSWTNLQVTNSLFDGNIAIGNGGGIGTYFYGNSQIAVYGCTFVHNRAHEVAGIHYQGFDQFDVDIATCIFWDNQDVNGIVSQSSVKEARYSCVQNLWVTIPGEDPIDPKKFPHCIDSNPQFTEPMSNYRLSASSPCIDAGDRTVFTLSHKCDLDGMWRFVDTPTVPNTGAGLLPCRTWAATSMEGGSEADSKFPSFSREARSTPKNTVQIFTKRGTKSHSVPFYMLNPEGE